jgi:hypothetical protein
VHPRRHPDTPDEALRVDRVVVITAGHHERHDETRFLMPAQQREILRRSHLYGDRAQWVDDRRPQRHQGQRRGELGLQNLFLALWLRHGL